MAVVARWHEQHPTGEREAFDRMQLMRTRELANAEARNLLDLVETDGRRTSVLH